MLRPTLAALAGAAALATTGAAHGAIIIYAASLSGPNESPANASPGIGSARVTVDDIAQTMRVQVSFSGLLGGVTASHIHCCTTVANAGTAGVATTTPTFTGFPSGVTSGTYDNTFDLTLATSYNPAFVSAQGGLASAEAVLLAGMATNKTYLNIHTSVVPGGEIRGFLAAIPEPGTWVLTIAGFGLIGAALRRRRATAIAA